MHVPTCSAHGVRIARDRSLQCRHPIKEHGVGRGGISERIWSTAAPTTGQEHGVEGGKENAATGPGPSRVDGHALNADARSADARVAHAQRTLRPWRRDATNFVKKKWLGIFRNKYKETYQFACGNCRLPRGSPVERCQNWSRFPLLDWLIEEMGAFRCTAWHCRDRNRSLLLLRHRLRTDQPRSLRCTPWDSRRRRAWRHGRDGRKWRGKSMRWRRKWWRTPWCGEIFGAGRMDEKRVGEIFCRTEVEK